MKKPDARIDAYIAAAPAYAQPILRHVRALVHRACPDVTETIKWSRPHFEHRGPMFMMSAFKAHCSLGFWRPEIRKLVDPTGSAEGAGQFDRITTSADLPSDAKLLGYLKAAAQLNESGVKAPPRQVKPKPALPVPPDLQKALKAQPKAAVAFDQFTASQRRDSLEWLLEAKTEPTREKRLATALEWIAEGKTRNWKYQKC